MGKYFDLAETEPIIADCIRQAYQHKKDWVHHEEIIQGLLNDPIGEDLIQRAFRRWKSEGHQVQWVEWRAKARNWASMMVQHFSQTGYFKYEKEFERRRDANGDWAYRPKHVA